MSSAQRTFLGAAVLTAILIPQVVWAQPTDAETGELSGFLTLFPELRTAPGPPILQPGVRITYDAGGAVFGGPGPSSGGGVVAYDVVARDGTQIVAVATRYVDLGSGSFPSGQSAARGFPGLGSFWISPSALTNAEAVAGGQLTVTRAPKTLADGQTVTVVRFQTTTMTGVTVQEFDAQTGLLVLSSVSGPGIAQQVTFRAVRTLSLPWQRARAPNWVRPGAALAFDGQQTTTLPGGGAATSPIGFRFNLREAGARWSIATGDALLNGVPQGSDVVVTGEIQIFGGLWISEAVRAAPLPQDGLQIDVDPIANATTFAARDADGRTILQQVTPASRTTYTFSATLGVLDRIDQEVNNGTSFVRSSVVRTSADAPLETLAQQPPLPEGPPEPAPDSADDSSGGCSAAPCTSAPLTPIFLWIVLLGAWKIRYRSERHQRG